MQRLFVGMNIDLSGCDKLHGDDLSFIKQVNEELLSLGFSPHIAIAPTLGAAWALSRFGKNRLSITTPQGLKNALRALHPAALRLEPEILKSLEELNIRCIDELLVLPRRSLLARFGPLVLKRLDQAFGYEEEPFEPTQFVPSLRSEKIFPAPVQDQNVIMQTAERLLEILLAKLGSQAQTTSQLILEIKKLDDAPFIKEITLHSATADYSHLWSLLSIQLERLDIGHGVEAIVLRVNQRRDIQALPTSHLPYHAVGTVFSTKQNVGKLLDILSEHLGPEEIRSIEFSESYFPEKSFSYRAASDNRAVRQNPRPDINSERPAVLFRFPAPIQVMAILPDNPPFWLKWKHTQYRIRHGVGPERIAPEWWSSDPAVLHTRDYFKVQLLSGLWLWIFHEIESKRWYLHGIWC